MKCPYCGADIQPTDIFCPSCNSPLPRTEQNSKLQQPIEAKKTPAPKSGSLRSVLIKKSANRKKPRTLESRRTILTEPDDVPDIQTFTEEYEKKYHIPTVGGFKASEIASSKRETPAWVKPASIITAITLFLVGGTVVTLKYTPIVKNIQTRQKCQDLTQREESEIGKWNDLVATAKPCLKFDPVEYTDRKIPEHLGDITSRQPKQLTSCAANPSNFKMKVNNVVSKNKSLKTALTLVQKDHRKVVSQAKSQALKDADNADKWMSSHQHAGVRAEQQDLSMAISAVRNGHWLKAETWLTKDGDVEDRLTKLQEKINPFDQKKQNQKKPDKPTPSKPAQPQQQSTPAQPAPAPRAYTAPRTYTPVQRARPAPQRIVPRSTPAPTQKQSAPSAPNNWNVPAPKQDEGRL